MQLSFTAPGPVQNLNFAFLPDDPDPSTTYNITSRAYNIPRKRGYNGGDLALLCDSDPFSRPNYQPLC